MNEFKLIRCPEEGCDDNKVYQHLHYLKKHLKEKHQKFMCDLCVDNKMCVLSQHKLYTQYELQQHLKEGDYDEMGNIYFYHPTCSFCHNYFYDEMKFVKHMNECHLTCHLCPIEHRFRFYKGYSNILKHFRSSHFLCEDVGCL